MTKQLTMIAMATLLTLGLSACSNTNRSIGKVKSVPDEFSVVMRPPLSLPPGFADKPGDIFQQGNNGDLSSQSQTAKLLGIKNARNTNLSGLFDFTSITDDIRTKIDEETYGIQLENQLPLQTLFGGLPDVGPFLDKMAEDTRLRKARLTEQAPTAGGTKAIDPASNQLITIN